MSNAAQTSVSEDIAQAEQTARKLHYSELPKNVEYQFAVVYPNRYYIAEDDSPEGLSTMMVRIVSVFNKEDVGLVVDTLRCGSHWEGQPSDSRLESGVIMDDPKAPSRALASWRSWCGDRDGATSCLWDDEPPMPVITFNYDIEPWFSSGDLLELLESY